MECFELPTTFFQKANKKEMIKRKTLRRIWIYRINKKLGKVFQIKLSVLLSRKNFYISFEKMLRINIYKHKKFGTK